MSLRRQRILLAGILLLALGLRLWGITWGLYDANVARRPHPDEWAVYWLFQWFGSTRSLNPCPSYPSQCFFDWGMVFPYLAYGVHLVLLPLEGLLPPSAFGPRADHAFVSAVFAGRLTSALLSVATVAVAYRLGRNAFGVIAGLTGALLVALCGLLLQLAHFGTPDSTTLFFMSLTLLACERVLTKPSRAAMLRAGACIGLAVGSEFHMALLLLPLGVAWWIGGTRSRGQLLAATGVAAIVFLAVNPYSVLDYAAFWHALEHTLRIRTVDSAVQYDDRWAAYGPSFLYVVRYPLGYGAGFLVTLWMLIGVARAVWRRSSMDLVLLAWTAPYFLLVTIEPAKFMRYSAPLLIPLAILAGRVGAEAAGRGLLRMRLGVAAIGGIALLYTSGYDLAYAGMFSGVDPRQAASSWVVAHNTQRQAVAFEVIPDGLLNLPYFLPSTVRPCFTEFRISRLQGSRFLMIDQYTPEEQPTAVRRELVAFDRALTNSSAYRLVHVVHFIPSFLGLSFPIDASPHDWRYPSHEIRVYERQGPTDTSTSCYTSIAAATAALYVPSAKRH